MSTYLQRLAQRTGLVASSSERRLALPATGSSAETGANPLPANPEQEVTGEISQSPAESRKDFASPSVPAFAASERERASPSHADVREVPAAHAEAPLTLSSSHKPQAASDASAPPGAPTGDLPARSAMPPATTTRLQPNSPTSEVTQSRIGDEATRQVSSAAVWKPRVESAPSPSANTVSKFGTAPAVKPNATAPRRSAPAEAETVLSPHSNRQRQESRSAHHPTLQLPSPMLPVAVTPSSLAGQPAHVVPVERQQGQVLRPRGNDKAIPGPVTVRIGTLNIEMRPSTPAALAPVSAARVCASPAPIGRTQNLLRRSYLRVW